MDSSLQLGQLSKLVVDLPEDDQASAELLWGVYLGDQKFRLQSVPVWAYDLAYEDVVEGVWMADGRIHVTGVTQRSGLLTVRIAGPDAPLSAFADIVQLFGAHAVATEHFSSSYSAFAIAKDEFQQLLPSVEKAEQTNVIHIEIANDDEGTVGE